MEDDEDDIYAPDEALTSDKPQEKTVLVTGRDGHATEPDGGESEEDGDMEEDESDSDIDIITERPDIPRVEPAPQAQRPTTTKSAAVKIESPFELAKGPQSPALKVDASPKPPLTPTKPGSSYPPYKTSTLDVNAKPIFEPTGKPITEIDMDADFPEDDKPWRRPGQNQEDYFNYGFDEFTWASYCLKQETLRKDGADQKKLVESLINMPIIPGAPGAPVGAQPGMEGVPPGFQEMFQTFFAQGMDPTQMDPSAFSMMPGGQAGMGGSQGFGQQSQNQQQMGYGYGGNSAAGGTGNRNQKGQGQGRRQW